MRHRTAGWRACGSQARAAHSDASPAPEREWRHQARHGEDLSARQSRPGDLDLRRRDPACHRKTLAARIGACNGARQRGDLLRECGVKAGGPLKKPCRTALREERALPSGVFGPRLRRPLARLASRLAALIMQSPNATPVHVLFDTVISGMHPATPIAYPGFFGVVAWRLFNQRLQNHCRFVVVYNGAQIGSRSGCTGGNPEVTAAFSRRGCSIRGRAHAPYHLYGSHGRDPGVRHGRGIRR